MNVTDEVRAIAANNFAFSNALDEQLRATEHGNLVFSPFSLALVLAMTRLGARNTTAKEMDAAIGFPHDVASIKAGYSKALMSIVEPSKHFNLTVVSKMFVHDGFQIRNQFVEDVKTTFNSTVKQLSFENTADAAGMINGWVSNQTQGKIKELFPAESLSHNETKLVLANAIFFRGAWAKPFDRNGTHKAPFYASTTENTEVDMMLASASFPSGELDQLNATVVVLPYKGGRFSMYIYVPAQKEGLELLQKGLRNSTMDHIRAKIEPEKACREVRLYLPKFKTESKLELVDPLQKMGVNAMFSNKEADFTDMVQENAGGVYVSDVVQRAIIDVNEYGTEAAAASGVQVRTKCFPQITEVKADRPFYYQIVDEKTNIIVFAGVVRNPS